MKNRTPSERNRHFSKRAILLGTENSTEYFLPRIFPMEKTQKYFPTEFPQEYSQWKIPKNIFQRKNFSMEFLNGKFLNGKFLNGNFLKAKIFSNNNGKFPTYNPTSHLKKTDVSSMKAKVEVPHGRVPPPVPRGGRGGGFTGSEL